MKKAVAYCRVSTSGQCGEDRFGIDSQKQMIEEFCEKKEIEIADWFIDEGVSGAKEHRPAFDQILNGCVSNPPVQYVVVAKTDRISRNINLYYAYKSMLDKLGLEILSVSEDWSAQDKLTGMILENFLAMAATVERESIRSRTSGGRRQKAKLGGFSGGRAPYGYYVKDGEMVVNEHEAEAVRIAFTLKDRGETLQSIAENLTSTGFTTQTGKPFTISAVHHILEKRKTYEGWYKYGDGDWVRGRHQAILQGMEED